MYQVKKNYNLKIKSPKQRVTQGARDKIILSIKRLRDRYADLIKIEREVSSQDAKDLKVSLLEIKTRLYTPIKHYQSGRIFEDCEEDGDLDNKQIHEDDLPSLFTRVLSEGLFVNVYFSLIIFI